MTTIDQLEELIPGIFGSDTVIERIELIDMLSPPKRNAAQMEKNLRSIGLEPDDAISELDSKNSLHEADRFSRLFGIERGELFELLDQFPLSSLPKIPIRSLSIPLEPGVSGAWAPNGYGKTFAIRNILQKMQVASGRNNTLRFENFIRSCNLKNIFDNYDNKLILNGWQSDNQGSWKAIKESSNLSRKQSKLIPFRELNFSLSCGAIISIRVDYGMDCDYQGFKIVVHSMERDVRYGDEEFVENVKLPVWLCLESNVDDNQNLFSISSSDYDDSGDEIDYDYLELREKLLERILNLAIDYVEIPRLSYNRGFFDEISSEFKKYLSIVLTDFESDHGPIVEYEQLYLRSLVERVNKQNPQARPPDGLFATLRSDFELACSELTDGIIDYQNELSTTFHIDPVDYQPIYSSESIDRESLQDIQYAMEILYRLDKFKAVFLSFETAIERWLYMNINFVHKLSAQGKKEYRKLEEGINKELEEMMEDISAILNEMIYQIEPTSLPEYIENVQDFMSRISEWVFPDSVAASTNLVTEHISQLEARLNSNLSSQTTPWSIRVKLLNWMIEPNSNVFAFEYEGGSEAAEFRASWDTLSFGQKSNFILQTILILEEGVNQVEPNYPLQRCLIIDEPEAGKAEAWVSQLIEDLQQHHFKLNKRKRSSVLILSHRGVILDSISDDGSYALMHAPSLQSDGED